MNADAMASGTRTITKDEAADLRVDFANMRADVLTATARAQATEERTRADTVAATERASTEARIAADRSRSNQAYGIAISVILSSAVIALFVKVFWN